MKVLLISHPKKYIHKPDFPPTGISYLGAVANGAGHETLLLDGGLIRIPEIVRKAKEFQPSFIGVTCWTIDRGMVWALCEALRKEIPKTFLCIGGPHATIFPEHIFKKTHASAVVIGEGEATFKELLCALNSGGDLKSIEGMALRNEDGTVYYTGSRAGIEKLDLIPKPFYEGFEGFKFSNYAGFASLPRPTASIISSRGCIFDCTYCATVAFWGNRWRYRSAENVLEEMEWLIEKMGAKSIYFFDDNFPVNKKRVIAICEGIINKKWNIKWACCAHVTIVNKEVLEIMKKSGCMSIDFGVESGSDKILRNIRKKQTRIDIEKTFALSHEVGIQPRSYLMVGNIGEDEKTIDETIEMIAKIKPRSSIGASILWLLPGTDEYNEAVKNGYMSEDFWLNSDDVPYNLQEHTYEELCNLRNRLMLGIARGKGEISPLISYYLKKIYYKYPFLSNLRSLIPNMFR